MCLTPVGHICLERISASCTLCHTLPYAHIPEIFDIFYLFIFSHKSVSIYRLISMCVLHRNKGKNPRAQSSKTHKASTLTRMAQQHLHVQYVIIFSHKSTFGLPCVDYCCTCYFLGCATSQAVICRVSFAFSLMPHLFQHHKAAKPCIFSHVSHAMIEALRLRCRLCIGTAPHCNLCKI